MKVFTYLFCPLGPQPRIISQIQGICFHLNFRQRKREEERQIKRGQMSQHCSTIHGLPLVPCTVLPYCVSQEMCILLRELLTAPGLCMDDSSLNLHTFIFPMEEMKPRNINSLVQSDSTVNWEALEDRCNQELPPWSHSDIMNYRRVWAGGLASATQKSLGLFLVLGYFFFFFLDF